MNCGQAIKLRNDDRATEMYAMYQSGSSLSEVAKRFGSAPQNVRSMFIVRGWKRRPPPGGTGVSSGRDLTGLRVGLLCVLECVGKPANSTQKYWKCICECGGTKVVSGSQLRRGKCKSCGCVELLNRKTMSTTHGLSGTAEHGIWTDMRKRCENKNHSHFHRYGGRGIAVCDRWKSFEAFYEDMGVRPSSKHTLERKDNDGNYCPENCVWALRKQQARNRSTTRFVVFRGERMSVAELAERTGTPYRRLHRMIVKRGLSAEQAVSEC